MKEIKDVDIKEIEEYLRNYNTKENKKQSYENYLKEYEKNPSFCNYIYS